MMPWIHIFIVIHSSSFFMEEEKKSFTATHFVWKSSQKHGQKSSFMTYFEIDWLLDKEKKISSFSLFGMV